MSRSKVGGITSSKFQVLIRFFIVKIENRVLNSVRGSVFNFFRIFSQNKVSNFRKKLFIDKAVT